MDASTSTGTSTNEPGIDSDRFPDSVQDFDSDENPPGLTDNSDEDDEEEIDIENPHKVDLEVVGSSLQPLVSPASAKPPSESPEDEMS